MKFQLLTPGSLILTALTSNAAAIDLSGVPLFNPLDPRFQQYQPPAPGASRSPCPALNSLANHGFVPRSGKGVTALDLITGAFLGMGVSLEVGVALVAAVLPSQRWVGTWNLEDTGAHNLLIEHDASLSRLDLANGDDNSFNQGVWNLTLSVIDKGNDVLVTPGLMGTAQGVQMDANKQRNPDAAYGAHGMAIATLANGLLMAVLGDSQGNANLTYIRSVFEKEQLPTHLGWKPSLLKGTSAKTLAFGIKFLTGDPDLLSHTSQILLNTPAETYDTLVPPGGTGNTASDLFLINLRNQIVTTLINEGASAK